MIDLVDFFGATFVAFILAIAEIVTIAWIYGVDRLCKDVEFMLDIKTSLYWRICWGVVTPIFMGTILVYYLITLEWANPIAIERDVKTGETLIPFPTAYKIFGYSLTLTIVLQFPIWMIIAIIKDKSETLVGKVFNAFQPSSDWGPRDPEMHMKYLKYLKENKYHQNSLSLVLNEHGLISGMVMYATKKLFY